MEIDAGFWREKWERNEIAFHRSEANPLLVKYFDALQLGEGSRVFVPLCGKTLDISYLLGGGYRVAGAELSTIAVEQLFTQLGVKPAVSKAGRLERHSANGIDIFVGDIFDLSSETLGHVDAVYDRAALVAFPENMRGRYASHLMEITKKAAQLLICYEYDQRVMDGPPFSVDEAEVKQLYDGRYSLTLLADESVPGGLKGKCPSREKVWLLR